MIRRAAATTDAVCGCVCVWVCVCVCVCVFEGPGLITYMYTPPAGRPAGCS